MGDGGATLAEELRRVGNLLERELRQRDEDRRARSRQPVGHRRSEPRHITYGLITALGPQLAHDLQAIPPEFWTLDTEVAVVSCPCGKTPEVERERMKMCECERMFIFSGKKVYVVNSPVPAQAPPDPDERDDPALS